MPNDKLANSTVINLSAPDQEFKVSLTIGVAYGTDPDKFVEDMLDIVKKAPEDIGIVTDDPDRGVWGRLNALNDSSMEFKVGFWVNDIMKQWSAAGYVRTKLYYFCVEKGIDIPFPQMDVRIIEKKQA
jgi:small-conductance mechanosensitive channel